MWIEQASLGDLEAFNQLVLRHQEMIYSHASRLLGDPDAAEDAAQETFIKAFQGLDGFRGGSFRRWLLQITTNSAYDLLRRFRRHPILPLYPEDESGEEVESPSWIADVNPSPHAVVEAERIFRQIFTE